MTDRTKQAPSPVELHRKAKLQALIDKRLPDGGAAALAREARRTQGYISHLSLPNYSFGKQAARSLERALALPVGYFDEGLATPPSAWSPEAARVVAAWSDRGPVFGSETITVPPAWATGTRLVAAPIESGRSLGIVSIDEAIEVGDLLLVKSRDRSDPFAAHLQLEGGRLMLAPLPPQDPTPVAFASHHQVLGSVIGLMTNLRRPVDARTSMSP
jgi:hypothetical protein